MGFFTEIEPGIHAGTEKALATEQDGEAWTRELDAILARGTPFAIIADVRFRPQPAAGKPMALWMKARKAALGALVRSAVYIAEDTAVRTELERNADQRARALPYPIVIAASRSEAVAKAREALR